MLTFMNSVNFRILYSVQLDWSQPSGLYRMKGMHVMAFLRNERFPNKLTMYGLKPKYNCPFWISLFLNMYATLTLMNTNMYTFCQRCIQYRPLIFIKSFMVLLNNSQDYKFLTQFMNSLHRVFFKVSVIKESSCSHDLI